MKTPSFCFATLLVLALSGQACAQAAPDAETYRKAAAAYFKAGQFQESAKAYQQVIRLKPNDTDAYDQLGEAYTRLGMAKEAAAAYEKEADILVSGKATAAPAPAATAPARAATPAPAPSQAMTLDEMARRLIRKQYQIVCSLSGIGEQVSPRCDSSSVPTRVTIDSVQVFPQGPDSFVVKAKYSVSGYYRDSTLVYDYEGELTGYKHLGSWEIRNDSANMKPGRYLAAVAAPATGPTDVPDSATTAGQAKAGTPSAANTGGPLQLGHYNCVMSTGGQLAKVGGFTLQADGVYNDENKGRGSYAYDAIQHQLTFTGAAMGGQVARYGANGNFTLTSARNAVNCDRGN